MENRIFAASIFYFYPKIIFNTTAPIASIIKMIARIDEIAPVVPNATPISINPHSVANNISGGYNCFGRNRNNAIPTNTIITAVILPPLLNDSYLIYFYIKISNFKIFLEFKNMSMHKALIRKILRESSTVDSPIPGEAPSDISTGSVITEPQNNPGGNIDQSLFDLYPDLINMDPTNACALAEYFASMCEVQQTQNQIAQQTQMVPSYAAQGTAQEF